MGQLNVSFKSGINTVATLSSLQIDVSHIGIFTNNLPKHVSLIVAQIYAVNVRTGVLAQNISYNNRFRQFLWRTANAVTDLFLCLYCY